ncbi:hypothetical protein [Agrococcus terreus]|uniref:PH domain-containing protein n=1 Tax=Agrococcus terreus TaxID=574649 RepID=A0ABQ2KK18_9MICO|nr:hypothetical protein [Agrococcus terreus]GGN85791.1 hypothetical protein GCM10010968_18970 [Agrococcus terreus]
MLTWGAIATVAVGFGTSLQSILGVAVAALGGALLLAAATFLVRSACVRVEARADELVFIGLWRRTAIPLREIDRIGRELGGDHVSEAFHLRPLGLPDLHHLRLDLASGESVAFTQITGLRRPVEHLVARLNALVRQARPGVPGEAHAAASLRRGRPATAITTP